MDDDTAPAGGNKKRAKSTVGIRLLPSFGEPPAAEEISVASQEVVAVGKGACPEMGEEELEEEEAGAVIACSEEMEVRIGQIFEKIEHFTNQVAEMLEAGKALFKNMSTEFEERLIAIHREQIDKWQEEIRELRLLDTSNEEESALLQKARYHLLQNVQMDF